MRKLIVAAALAMSFALPAAAQKSAPQHLLDGTQANYFYTNGRAIHIEFYDGQLKYEWIAGPTTGKGNGDLPYQSRKIDEGTYLVSWLEQAHPDYVTLVLNFKTNVMYSSGIVKFATKDQMVVFDGGILEDVRLVAKE